MKIIYLTLAILFLATNCLYSMDLKGLLYGNTPLYNLDASFNNAQEKASYWLPIASYAGNEEKVKELLSFGPNLNDIKKVFSWWRNGPSIPALHAAVIMGNTAIVKMLLINGANPNLNDPEMLNKDKFFATTVYELPNPPEWLYEFPRLDISGMGGTVTITPLMYAAKGGFNDITELLLKAGANPSLQNVDGNTAADYSASSEIKNLITHYSKGAHLQVMQATTVQEKKESKPGEIVTTTPSSYEKTLKNQLNKLRTTLNKLNTQLIY